MLLSCSTVANATLWLHEPTTVAVIKVINDTPRHGYITPLCSERRLPASWSPSSASHPNNQITTTTNSRTLALAIHPFHTSSLPRVLVLLCALIHPNPQLCSEAAHSFSHPFILHYNSPPRTPPFLAASTSAWFWVTSRATQ